MKIVIVGQYGSLFRRQTVLAIDKWEWMERSLVQVSVGDMTDRYWPSSRGEISQYLLGIQLENACKAQCSTTLSNAEHHTILRKQCHVNVHLQCRKAVPRNACKVDLHHVVAHYANQVQFNPALKDSLHTQRHASFTSTSCETATEFTLKLQTLITSNDGSNSTNLPCN